jgi:hypothetical protein
MAIQTRYSGDAQGINNVDAKTDGTLDTIVATGLTKNPVALKITTLTGSLTAAESGTGGPVEAILRSIAIDSTVVMYQVSSDRISVLVEATGAGSSDGTTTAAAAIQARIRALTNSANSPIGNIGISANIYAPLVTVTTSGGIKFA